jgi:hypothetical protein
MKSTASHSRAAVLALAVCSPHRARRTCVPATVAGLARAINSLMTARWRTP